MSFKQKHACINRVRLGGVLAREHTRLKITGMTNVNPVNNQTMECCTFPESARTCRQKNVSNDYFEPNGEAYVHGLSAAGGVLARGETWLKITRMTKVNPSNNQTMACFTFPESARTCRQNKASHDVIEL